MNTETSAFEPTEEQIRHHNNALLTPEYLAIEGALVAILNVWLNNELLRRSIRSAENVLDDQLNTPWVWTGKRGPVVIVETAYEANHGTDPAT